MTLCDVRMDPEDINDLATKVAMREVYLRVWCEEDMPDIQTAWSILFAFMDELYFTEENWKNVGAVYAPMSSAFPMAINGIPQFSKMAFVHKDDLAALLTRLWEIDNFLKLPAES